MSPRCSTHDATCSLKSWHRTFLMFEISKERRTVLTRRRVPYAFPQGMVAAQPLGQRHSQAFVHRVGDLVGVEWVDDQRLSQVLGRAGKPRQDQDAGIPRILCGDVFLGHEVHAVAQRRHHAEAGDPEESREQLPPYRAGHIAQRHPVELGEAAVGVADNAIQLAPQTLVAAGLLAGPRGDLQEADLAAMLGIFARSGQMPRSG